MGPGGIGGNGTLEYNALEQSPREEIVRPNSEFMLENNDERDVTVHAYVEGVKVLVMSGWPISKNITARTIKNEHIHTAFAIHQSEDGERKVIHDKNIEPSINTYAKCFSFIGDVKDDALRKRLYLAVYLKEKYVFAVAEQCDTATRFLEMCAPLQDKSVF